MIFGAVGLVTPVANSLRRSGCQERISVEGADGGDSAVFGNMDFQGDIARAVGGESIGGIFRLDAAEEAAIGLCGGQPHGMRCGV